jgi:hypothetical protein
VGTAAPGALDGGEPGLAQNLHEGHCGHAESLGGRQPFDIDPAHDPAHRGPGSFLVDAEVAGSGLDPASVAHHLRGAAP